MAARKNFYPTVLCVFYELIVVEELIVMGIIKHNLCTLRDGSRRQSWPSKNSIFRATDGFPDNRR